MGNLKCARENILREKVKLKENTYKQEISEIITEIKAASRAEHQDLLPYVCNFFSLAKSQA